MNQCQQTVIPHQEWRDTAELFTQQVKSWTEPYRKKKGKGAKHPVHDFLFSYYSYSMGRLETWHPGFGVLLESPPLDHFSSKYYREINGTVFLDPTLMPHKRIPRLRWIQKLLESTQERPANFSCFGLHEWAMVYQAEDVRHRESAPLRLTQQETNKVLESRTVRCTHYDAYRFFSSSAHSMNKLNPESETLPEFEQPGCLHTNMDLYKWCYKAMPWISSDILWQCFLLAKDIRELDMRASPYDLTEYNLTPVKIETKQGREEYESLQRSFSLRSEAIRKSLIQQLNSVLNIAEGIENRL
ncbi:MAG: 3-methyladenine DNA glycosylase [Akkermansiaceae bacterium]